MRPESQALVRDAIRALEQIEHFTAGKSGTDFAADDMLRAAVERGFTITGEALNRLRQRAPDLAAGIAGLPEAIGLRNVLVHGYSVVNDDVLWLTVTDDVPPLLATLRALVESHD